MFRDESMGAQPGFFDVDHRMKRLSDLGDQLEAFGSAVDFEIFRGDLVLALAYSENGQGGRPPLDPVMMFKILVIQAANNLSDERAEYLINDRLSFMRFLGLSLGDRVPDARTIWLFREWLTRATLEGKPAIEVLFSRVIVCRRQKRQSALTLTWAPGPARRAFNSGRVMSGASAKAAWMRSAWASVRRESRSPPCGLGRASPPARRIPARRIPCQRIALDALTPNRAAAWRHDRPSLMAARTRERRSKDS